jgi:hypothetical protein
MIQEQFSTKTVKIEGGKDIDRVYGEYQELNSTLLKYPGLE